MKTRQESVPCIKLVTLVLLMVVLAAGTPPQVDKFAVRLPIPRIESLLTKVTMYLDCSGSGDPAPAFKFVRKGVTITKDYADKRLTVKDNTLTIANLNTSDTGLYICIAENPFGSVPKELDVKVRVLGDFVPNARAEKDTRDHSITLYKETTLKCPSRSYTYPLIIEWGNVPPVENERARVKRIPISNRVFYGNDGSLNFANVIPSDLDLINNDYRGIQCLISVGLVTRASNRFKLRKDREFSKDYTREPNFAAFMDVETVIVKDQESIFTCGGFGKPTPSVEWYKDGVRIRNLGGGTTNFAGYTLNQEVELRIVRPRKEDEGVFRCWIRNIKGAKYKDATLLVHYKPTWVLEIKDVSMPVQSSQMLNCSSDAKPAAQYIWYKNSTLLTPSPNIKIDRGVLWIMNARLFDRGMYVCMAKNKYGSITTQAFADVQAVKPKFVTRLPDPMYLFRSRIGRIPCDPTGGPIPDKTWYKNNILIGTTFDKRYSVNVNGTLIINNVQNVDKGRYRCFAKNIKGSDETSANVIVVEPTVITQGPSAPNGGSTIKQGRDLVLVCDATYDKNLQLRIDWHKDGELIKTFDDRFSLEKRVGDAAPRLLVIKALKYEDRGNYTCNAYTVLSTTANIRSVDTKSAILSVSAPAEAPSTLKFVISCQAFKPVVYWTVGEHNADTMKYVQLEYTSEYPDDAGIWYIAGKSFGESANQFAFGTKDNPIQLPGHAAIKFRAIAVNQVAPSRPSVSTLGSQCITPNRRPMVNPINVRIVATDSSKLSIVWDRMKIIDQGGPFFTYEVAYRVVNQAWRKVNVTNSTYQYTVASPGAFILYEACVTAYNIKGPSTARLICVKQYSWQAKPAVAPSGLRVTKIEFTRVDLAWTSLVLGRDRNIRGYRLYIWNVTAPFRPVITRGEKKKRRRRAIAIPVPTAAKPRMVEYLVDNDNRFVQNISLLTPAIRYNLYITAFNSGGEGPRSNVVTFQTIATKSGIPDNIKMTVYGNVLHVQWESPLAPNGITTGFIMRLDPKRDSQKKKSVDHIVVDKIDREYYIRGMTPCKFYDVWIAAMNQNGEGQFYRRRVAVSYPDKPGTPKLPRVVPYDANSVNITYKLPGYGGLPTSFTVYYKHKDGAYYDADPYYNSESVKQANFLKQPWQTVKGLPELEYAFYTVGHNELGSSIPSDRVISQVMPYTTPTIGSTTVNTTRKALNASESNRRGPGVRTVEGPWYSSKWFVGALACVLFFLLVLIVIMVMIKKGGGKYNVGVREKSHGGWNGQPAGEFHNTQDDYDGPSEPAEQTTDFIEARPPPRYPSQSSVEKKPMSDDQDSFDEYGEDNRFNEDGSFIGQYGEEKRREAEEEDEEDPNASMFI